MALNVISAPAIFLSQVTKYSLRNRPYEASRRGLARWLVASTSPSLETTRKKWKRVSENRIKFKVK